MAAVWWTGWPVNNYRGFADAYPATGAWVQQPQSPAAWSALLRQRRYAEGRPWHWHDGKIHNYQIIAPITWNFSPRGREGIPGPLEQALIDTPVKPGETGRIAVQHVIRSFDPCMVYTVH